MDGGSLRRVSLNQMSNVGYAHKVSCWGIPAALARRRARVKVVLRLGVDDRDPEVGTPRRWVFRLGRRARRAFLGGDPALAAVGARLGLVRTCVDVHWLVLAWCEDRGGSDDGAGMGVG